MPLNLENLEDESIRDLMLEEFEKDVSGKVIYLSPRLKEDSHDLYIELMKKAIKNGNDESLSNEIGSNNSLKEFMPRRNPSGSTTMARVPRNASTILSEGEFNRFYLRALCLKVIKDGNEIEVYRAKSVNSPRPESEALIGKVFDGNKLLTDLRTNVGVDTALGLPSGPNSGLSGKIKK